MEEVFSLYREIENKREKLAFHIDGVVVKINDLKMWPTLGIVGKAPRYEMAYKFSAEQAVTKIIDIVWQVGRTGALTPTAILEPVKVGGVIIARSTLHNFDEIERLGLKIGDSIVIERSGDVIPKVVEVLKKLRLGGEKKINPPSVCPICGGGVIKEKGEVAYRCANKRCYAVNLRQIIHFVSKGAADLDGLGPKLIEQFLTSGLIKDAADLYSLRREDLLSLERFAEKKADNVIKMIDSRRSLDLARFIYGLGIRHVGEETAGLLAEKLNQDSFSRKNKIELPDLVNKFRGLDEEYFLKLADIGPIVAKSIVAFWNNEHNLALLDKFHHYGLSLSFPAKDAGDEFKKKKLSGLSFVLTGSLDGLTRGGAKDKIKTLGGKSKENVARDVDYVIAGAEPGSKLAKAKKLGIKILNEEEFLKMIN
jgi:DNA ligase (NAD+)